MKNENLDLKKSLEFIGFSEKEVNVYLAILLLGKGTVTEISRRAGINRPTAYHILSSLSSKELVKISGKEPKQEYTAESPDQIEKLIREKIKNDEKILKEAKKVIPELKSIHNIKNRPKIYFYEGNEGIEKVYEDTLTSSEPIRAYASVENMHEGLSGYFPDYYKRRSDQGIYIRAIIPDSKTGRERKSFDKKEKRESALVPKEMFDFIPEINIYDNKVMIASWREKLGVIIESSEIADAMKKIYELAWAEAKRLDKSL
jgi:sugar-specific transcriptional regulator TrmB